MRSRKTFLVDWNTREGAFVMHLGLRRRHRFPSSDDPLWISPFVLRHLPAFRGRARFVTVTTSRLREWIVIVCYEACHNFAIGPATGSVLDESSSPLSSSEKLLNSYAVYLELA